MMQACGSPASLDRIRREHPKGTCTMIFVYGTPLFVLLVLILFLRPERVVALSFRDLSSRWCWGSFGSDK